MSKKGLDWALHLRADLRLRIENLRESLAAIEPLRQELARLEEQLKGVERLVAVYHDQLGYPKPEEEEQAQPQPAALMQEAGVSHPPVGPDPALVPKHVSESSGPAAILRMEMLRTAGFIRKAAGQLWLSFSAWLSKRLPRRTAQL